MDNMWVVILLVLCMAALSWRAAVIFYSVMKYVRISKEQERPQSDEPGCRGGE